MNIIYEIENINVNNIKQKRVPTLIKNGLQYFNKLKSWDERYIIENYGNSNCNYSYHARPVRSKLETTYYNYFNNLKKNSYTFTRTNYDINNNNNFFINDLTFPNPFFNKEDIDKYIFYSGPKNTGALPHSHGSAFNLMVYGKKKWIFFDTITNIGKLTEQNYYKKYPRDVTYNYWYEKEYLLLKNTLPIIECIQEQTDIIYIPNKFNHSVLNLDDTMGIVVELF